MACEANPALGLLANLKYTHEVKCSVPSRGNKYNDLKSESTSMGNTKEEVMSLRLADEMNFSLCARSCVYHVGFYRIPYIRVHILGVGSANARKHHRLMPESISSCIRSLCT